MATFELTGPDGGTYHVDAPDEHAAIAAFSAFHGIKMPDASTPDKYQQAAIDERAATNPGDAGFTRRLAHGATLGADSTILAGLETPLEMIKRGTLNPAEGYNYAKAREDLIMDKARQNTGLLGTATEALGGAVSAGGLAKAGITAARALPEGAGFIARTGAGAADAAALGGVSGAMEGNGLKERAVNAGIGAAVGAGLGATVPGLVAAVKFLSTPITSQISARIDPKLYAQSQVARAISEGKMTAADVELALLHAQNEGQGVFTVADALGNPGQRMLSTVARSPGDGRTAVVDAMNSRQGDQGRRLTGALREGFDAPRTAEQTRQGMVKDANAEAGVNYAPVKSETQPIDVSRPVALANRSISPAADMDALAQGRVATDLEARAPVEAQESVIRDPISSVVKEARSYLAAPTLTLSNVGKAFRAKTNIDQMISKAADNKQGALVAELTPIRDALDDQLAKSSKTYANARDAYRVRQQRIEALDKGKEIGSKPGLPEDAIDQFNPLDAEAKQAFRVGYVDPQVSQVQNSAFGTNKARPLTSDAIKQEFDAIATPGRAEGLQRKIGRENTMFETRNMALGGSRTAENLNDDAAMAVSPEVLGVLKHVISGNFGGAVSASLMAGKNAFTGNTAAVRKEVADILLMDGKRFTNGRLQAMVDSVINRSRRAAEVADGIRRGAVGGAVVTGPGQNRR